MDTNGRRGKERTAEPVKAGCLLLNANDRVREWVGARLGIDFHVNTTGVGIIRNDKIVAGVLYQEFPVQGQPWLVEASIASDSPTWASRQALFGLFWVPFVHMKARRLQTRCRADAADVARFNARLGFLKEGTMREGWPLGGDAFLFSMTPKTCRWIER